MRISEKGKPISFQGREKVLQLSNQLSKYQVFRSFRVYFAH